MAATTQKAARQLMAFVGITLITVVAWYGWLGWDQPRDEDSYGATSEPYEAWQVIGLVFTLLVPMVWAATRRYSGAAVAGITIGLTGAAFYDWGSDDSSGLYIVGTAMIMIGSAVLTTVTATVISALANRAGSTR
jgi:hypothetical protein